MLLPIQSGYIGVEVIDRDEILNSGNRFISPIAYGKRGLSHIREDAEINFLYRKKLGRKPRDLDDFENCWLVSDSCARFLMEWTPDTFDFRAGTLSFEDGSAPRKVWLCDVVRAFDAIDRQRSKVEFADPMKRLYKVAGRYDLVFDRETVRGSRIFRDKHVPVIAYCDHETSRQFKKRSLRGAVFRKVGDFY